MQTALLTAAAMLAFAANSLLCRLALGAELIDAASFTTLRVASGALLLYWLLRRRRPAQGESQASDRTAADWPAVASLCAYLLCFSFAYRSLDAGSGALILFGSVQLTMFVVALRNGERFAPSAWLGLALAVAGIVWLLAPGASAPPLGGGALMAAAGIGWGVYSLRGRSAVDALAATTRNFALAVPFVAAVNLALIESTAATASGAVIAVVSGTAASALGYVVWYRALRGLTAMSAATVQLSVPVIAAFGGVVLLGEQPTLRLALASALVLGGIALAILRRRPRLAGASAQ